MPSTKSVKGVAATSSAQPTARRSALPAPKPRATKSEPVKPATKPVIAPKAKASKALVVKMAQMAKPAKTIKPKLTAPAAPKPLKNKLVRDSFTMPKLEYAVIETLKQRGAKLGKPLKKSEVLRAGVKALAAMADDQFAAALAEVPAIKTGRPKSKKPVERTMVDTSKKAVSFD